MPVSPDESVVLHSEPTDECGHMKTDVHNTGIPDTDMCESGESLISEELGTAENGDALGKGCSTSALHETR